MGRLYRECKTFVIFKYNLLSVVVVIVVKQNPGKHKFLLYGPGKPFIIVLDNNKDFSVIVLHLKETRSRSKNLSSSFLESYKS